MLIITGSIAYDNILDFPGKFADHILPDQIHKINISFNVARHQKRRGGTAGNLVYNLHLLTTPSLLYARAGNDFIEYKYAFEHLGIDTSAVVVDASDNTSTGFAITDRTNNQIWGFSYGAGSKISGLSLKKVAQKNDFVVIGPCGAKNTIHFVKQCVDLQIPFLFDPSFILADISREELLFGLKHCKMLIGNDYEMTLIKNRLKNWQSLFRDIIVITTLGEKGSIITSNNKRYAIPIVKPKKIVDPTGAGDAWRAGFLAGYVRGLDLSVCGQIGATTASFAIEHYGTQEHSFSKKDFQKRYRQAFGKLIEL